MAAGVTWKLRFAPFQRRPLQQDIFRRVIESLAEVGVAMALPSEVIRREKSGRKPVRLCFGSFFRFDEGNVCFLILGKILTIIAMHEDMAEFVGNDEARFWFTDLGVVPDFFVDVQGQRIERDVGECAIVFKQIKLQRP